MPTFDEELLELRDRYPGSRHTKASVLEAEGKPQPAAEADDLLANERPREMQVGDRVVEFFTIGALARALNREVVTLRKWEKLGYIPPAPYRADGKKQDRLYARAHIEGLVAIATEEGLMDPAAKNRLTQTRFPARARALFDALKGLRR